MMPALIMIFLPRIRRCLSSGYPLYNPFHPGIHPLLLLHYSLTISTLSISTFYHHQVN